MPNWGQVAERIARGMFGDRWSAEDEAAQKLEQGKLGMELSRSREGRESEQFGHNKSMWGSEVERATNLARQSGTEASRSELELGATPDRIRREGETHERAGKESGARIRGLESEISNRVADNARANALLQIQREQAARAGRQADLDYETGAATQASRIFAANHPEARDRKVQQSRWMTQIERLLATGDEEDAKVADRLTQMLQGSQADDERDEEIAAAQQAILDRRVRGKKPAARF